MFRDTADQEEGKLKARILRHCGFEVKSELSMFAVERQLSRLSITTGASWYHSDLAGAAG